jgi:hypothetical protein
MVIVDVLGHVPHPNFTINPPSWRSAREWPVAIIAPLALGALV